MKILDKLAEAIERYLLPIANKIGQQRHVNALRDGITATLPITLIGSFFLILRVLPLPGYRELVISSGIDPHLGTIVSATMNLVALIAVIAIPFYLSEKIGIKEYALQSTIITFICFNITVMPVSDGGLNFNYLGAKSIFIAIIMGLITPEIIKKVINKGAIITLPDTVPPAIAKSFASLIPGFVAVLFWGILTAIMTFTDFNNIHDFINIVIGTPLRYAGNSYAGHMMAVFLTSLLWCFGLHGSSIVSAVVRPLWMENVMLNSELAAQGLDNVYSNGFALVTGPFQNITMKIGGAGATFSLVLLMFFSAKSKQLKELGKLSISPAIFNINEPVIFGSPIVMNPLLMIPFIVAPLITTTISWIVMRTDLVKVPFALVPWTLPPVFLGFLSSGLSVSVAILSIVNILLSLAIYYPFFKMYDKQLVAQETGAEIEVEETEKTKAEVELI